MLELNKENFEREVFRGLKDMYLWIFWSPHVKTL